MSTQAYLGLGSNLGERVRNLADALVAIGDLPGTSVDAVAHAYESEPWGAEVQPPFANTVARVSTTLAADALLEHIDQIETGLGRVRTRRYGPRVIDIDILLFGDEEWAAESLVVPHPRLRERAFAVVPLLELWPDAVTPDGRPIELSEAREGAITRVLGPVQGFEALTPGGWVSVAESPAYTRRDRAPDVGLAFKEIVLRQEGIPYAYDPYAPTEAHNAWGIAPTIRLMVPAVYRERAEKLLAEVESAPPLTDEVEES